jgi:hypothetical protein
MRTFAQKQNQPQKQVSPTCSADGRCLVCAGPHARMTGLANPLRKPLAWRQ